MKTFAQKSFEKLLMLERNEKLGIAVVHHECEPCVCVGIGRIDESDRWDFTPLAKLLTWDEISQMRPDEEKTVKLQKLLDVFRDDTSGVGPDDFKEDIEHPLLTRSALDEAGL